MDKELLQPSVAEKPPEPLPEDEPARHPETTIEITPEARALAFKTLQDSLELEVKEDLSDFNEKLTAATKSLPRYQEIVTQLEGITSTELPKKIFDLLKKGVDKPENDPDVPRDGVLIRSMRQGHLECAGRSLIASTILQEAGIEHSVVSAPGHSFVVIEKDADTLAYFDANNDLYFTFPRAALKGYEGPHTSAECELQEYEPRDKDEFDGGTPVFPHFVAMPAVEGRGRQYLGNVGAMLNGNEESEGSGFPIDKVAAEAAGEWPDKVFGNNDIINDFFNRMDPLLENEDLMRQKDREIVTKIYAEYPKHEDFIKFFTQTLADDSQVIKRLPFLKKQPTEEKRKVAERAWQMLESGKLSAVVGGR